MRIGLNIHPTINGQQYSAQDKIYLTEFLRQLRPDAIVVMDMFESALAYKILLPDTNVIYRKYSTWEGNLWDWPPGADAWWYNMQDSRDPRLTLYVTNESHGAAAPEDIPVMRKAVAWWIRIMELATKDGIRLCLPNWGTGNPDMKWFTDDKLWAVVEPLFQAFKKYPQHYFGLHHYYWKEIEPGDGNVDRHRDIRTALSARGYGDLQYVLTEVGSDDVFLRNERGWKNTLTEQEYIQTLVAATRTAWNDPHIKGAAIFCWGGSGDWPPFNIMHATDLHKALIAMNNQVVEIPMPTPIPLPYVPPRANKGNGERFTITTAGVLQAQPSADVNCYVGKLEVGEIVTVYRDTHEFSDGLTWHYYERFSTPVGQSNIGWNAHKLPPPIEVTPPPDEIAQIAAIVAKLHGLSMLVESVANDLHKLAVDMAAKKAA